MDDRKLLDLIAPRTQMDHPPGACPRKANTLQVLGARSHSLDGLLGSGQKRLHGLWLALLVIVMLAPVLAVVGHRTAFAQKAPAAVPGGSKTAQAVYKKHCQVCHLDGDAPLEALNFVDRKWAHGSRLNDVVRIVRGGVPATAMIGFKDILTPEEIRAVAEYVRAFDTSLKPEKR